MNFNQDASVALTKLLPGAAAGDRAACNQLASGIYEELRGMAHGVMRLERPDHTLQTTGLVHEALMRLFEPRQLEQLKNRRMLFYAAARAMRQVLIDHARSRQALKHGGNWVRVPLDDAVDSLQASGFDLEALQQAMTALEERDARWHEIITLRFFAEREVQEIADLMELSKSTVEKSLKSARQFLREQMAG